jgi:hypothetical protein
MERFSHRSLPLVVRPYCRRIPVWYTLFLIVAEMTQSFSHSNISAVMQDAIEAPHLYDAHLEISSQLQ